MNTPGCPIYRATMTHAYSMPAQQSPIVINMPSDASKCSLLPGQACYYKGPCIWHSDVLLDDFVSRWEGIHKGHTRQEELIKQQEELLKAVAEIYDAADTKWHSLYLVNDAMWLGEFVGISIAQAKLENKENITSYCTLCGQVIPNVWFAWLHQLNLWCYTRFGQRSKILFCPTCLVRISKSPLLEVNNSENKCPSCLTHNLYYLNSTKWSWCFNCALPVRVVDPTTL